MKPGSPVLPSIPSMKPTPPVIFAIPWSSSRMARVQRSRVMPADGLWKASKIFMARALRFSLVVAGGVPDDSDALLTAAQRTGATGDFFLERLAQAQQEAGLGDHEQWADDQLQDVVHEGRLAAFPGMADELDHPADNEEADARRQPGAGRLCRAPGAERDRQRVAEQRREPERHVQAQVEGNQREYHEHHRAQGNPGELERRPRQQGRNGEDDERDADEVGSDVAAVAMVRRKSGQTLGEGRRGLPTSAARR